MAQEKEAEVGIVADLFKSKKHKKKPKKRSKGDSVLCSQMNPR